MSCAELDRLREQATALRHRVNEQCRKARAKSNVPRTGRASGTSELVPFLERKLQRVAEKIELHKAGHRCQD